MAVHTSGTQRQRLAGRRRASVLVVRAAPAKCRPQLHEVAVVPLRPPAAAAPAAKHAAGKACSAGEGVARQAGKVSWQVHGRGAELQCCKAAGASCTEQYTSKQPHSATTHKRSPISGTKPLLRSRSRSP